MANFYQGERDRIRDNLVLMGEKAVELVRLSVDSLLANDPEVANRLRNLDDEIDDLEKEIDSASIRYISLRAPVAYDLRLLTTAMKLCHDIERVGDEASVICKYVTRMAKNGPVQDFYLLPEMTPIVLDQLRNSLDSFIEEDIEKAYSVPAKDKQVDKLNRENYKSLTACLKSQTACVDHAIALVFISKSLERIGDHATNIAEMVIYLLEGDDVRHTKLAKRPEKTA